MTDHPRTKISELPGTSPWPRVLLAACDLGIFVAIFALVYWLAEPLDRAGVSWWIPTLTAVSLLVVADVALRRLLLRPAVTDRSGPSAAADRLRE
jgi:hypothetical protein